MTGSFLKNFYQTHDRSSSQKADRRGTLPLDAAWIVFGGLFMATLTIHWPPGESGRAPQSNAGAKSELLTQTGYPSSSSSSLSPMVSLSASQPGGGSRAFIESFEKAIDIGLRGGAAGAALSSPLEQAAAHWRKGDFARAEEALRRGMALAEAQGDILRHLSKVFIALGELRRTTGDLVRAETAFQGQFEQTERQQPERLEHLEHMDIRENHADTAPKPIPIIREAKGETNGSEALLRAQLRKAQETSDRKGMARAHVSLAVLSQQNGDAASACVSVARARILFAQAQSAPRDVDEALTPLAALQCPDRSAAAPAVAAPALARTPEKTRASQPLDNFAGWIKLAARQEAAGEFDGALTSARIAARLAKTPADKKKAAAALANLGSVHLARNHNEVAEVAYQASLSLYQELDQSSEPAREGAVAASTGLCAVLQARGRTDRAREICERGVQARGDVQVKSDSSAALQ